MRSIPRINDLNQLGTNENMSNTHHVCFSGSLACSGPNPCKTCFDLVNQQVIAFAMRESGLSLQQGQALFAWIEEGWRRLHTQMMQDPNIAQRALDVSRVRFDPPPRPMPAAPSASPPMPPARAPMAPMTFPMTPQAPAVAAAPTVPAPTASMATAIADVDALPFDPSAPFDPRLLSDPRFLQMLAPMMQVMQAMQGSPMMQAMLLAQEAEEQAEQEEDSEEADEVVEAPSQLPVPAPAPASLPAAPSAPLMRTQPSVSVDGGHGNGVNGSSKEMTNGSSSKEMSVEEVMMMASPLDSARIPDVEEPALEGAVNGSSST